MKVTLAPFLWFVNIHKLDLPLYTMTYLELLVVKLKCLTLNFNAPKRNVSGFIKDTKLLKSRDK